jgi:hypothetical protein
VTISLKHWKLHRERYPKRNLSTDRLDVAKKAVIQEDEIAVAKANIPLEGGYKALTFFFPGIILLMISSALRTKGYEKKSK